MLQHGPQQWEELEQQLCVPAPLCALKWHGLQLSRSSHARESKAYTDWELCVLFLVSRFIAHSGTSPPAAVSVDTACCSQCGQRMHEIAEFVWTELSMSVQPCLAVTERCLPPRLLPAGLLSTEYPAQQEKPTCRCVHSMWCSIMGYFSCSYTFVAPACPCMDICAATLGMVHDCPACVKA